MAALSPAGREEQCRLVVPMVSSSLSSLEERTRCGSTAISKRVATGSTRHTGSLNWSKTQPRWRLQPSGSEGCGRRSIGVLSRRHAWRCGYVAPSQDSNRAHRLHSASGLDSLPSKTTEKASMRG